jgi:hypothetical protein
MESRIKKILKKQQIQSRNLQNIKVHMDKNLHASIALVAVASGAPTAYQVNKETKEAAAKSNMINH